MFLVATQVIVARADYFVPRHQPVKPTGGWSNSTQTSVAHFSGLGMSSSTSVSWTSPSTSVAAIDGHRDFGGAAVTRAVIERAEPLEEVTRACRNFHRALVEPARFQRCNEPLRAFRHLRAAEQGEQGGVIVRGQFFGRHGPRLPAIPARRAGASPCRRGSCDASRRYRTSPAARS